MIYVTGDTHGMPARLAAENLPFAKEWGEDDYLIVCGDFGYLYAGTTREELVLRDLSFRPYNILFLDGNHENFDMLAQYPVTQWRGGKVQRIRRNVIHLMRRQVYNIGGQKLFTMGGGYSIDRFRRHEGSSWWPQEMPSAEEYQEARRNLVDAGMQVDYVLSHAAPQQAMNLYFSDNTGERPLNEVLEWVRENVRFNKWYFAHLHMDDELVNGLYAIFMSVRELTTGRVVG